MERVVEHIMTNDLSGDEMNSLLHGIADVKTFDVLTNATPSTLFAEHNRIALLFPVGSVRQGHWIAVWLDQAARTVHHFDPYGLTPEAEETYSHVPEGHQRLLEKFALTCNQAGLQFVSNPTRYQVMTTGVNTCGRHVICRLRLAYLSHDQYAALMLHQKYTPDELVTTLTLLALNEDQSDNAEIRAMLR